MKTLFIIFIIMMLFRIVGYLFCAFNMAAYMNRNPGLGFSHEFYRSLEIAGFLSPYITIAWGLIIANGYRPIIKFMIDNDIICVIIDEEEEDDNV